MFGDKDQLSNLFKQLKNCEVEDFFLSGLSLYSSPITFLLEILFPKKIPLILSAYSYGCILSEPHTAYEGWFGLQYGLDGDDI